MATHVKCLFRKGDSELRILAYNPGHDGAIAWVEHGRLSPPREWLLMAQEQLGSTTGNQTRYDGHSLARNSRSSSTASGQAT